MNFFTVRKRIQQKYKPIMLIFYLVKFTENIFDHYLSTPCYF